ncbi:MAG: hypothetical protein WC839_02705 [Candidatus Paceibacterota bacterium]
MKKHGTKSETLSISGIMQKIGSLAGFIVDFLTTLLSEVQIDYWLGHKNELKKKLREVFSIVDEYANIREEWQKFYKTHFNWDVDFSRVIIPNRPDGNWRLLFIAKGMTMNKAFDCCKAIFKSWRYSDDLDKTIPTNIRTSSDNYAVWVRDDIEPDIEYLGKSTRQADADMKIGITVLERIILEIKYFSETGNHLDIKGVTFCSGSRYSDGYVPNAYWDSVGFLVSWYYLDGSNSSSGIRSAISL